MSQSPDYADRDLERIAAQSRWVRRLAVALARDTAAGEDIAQDALLAAMRERRSEDDPRGWLFGVVRNLARLRLRSDDRRISRERRSAREDRVEEASAALVRLELQETLMGAVRELPEPYRTTVLLRWFEELDPVVIAQRTNTPIRTVHTRLQRALIMLREALDRRAHGDRARWLSAWLPTIAQPVALLPWILAMQTKTKLAAAALAVFAALSVWLTVEALHGPEPAPSSSLASEKVQFDEMRSAEGTSATSFDAKRAVVQTDTASVVPGAIDATGLTVRSSTSLALPFIEWRTSLGDWKRRDLDHGHCETTAMELPCAVRAPGHVPADVERDGVEIVLEPDELLIIEGDDLRACTSSIRVDDVFRSAGVPVPEVFQRILVADFVSPRAWMMAVSHDLIEDWHFAGVAKVTVIWRDQQRTDLELSPIPGVRARWALSCKDRPACSPLKVLWRRPTGTSSRGRISLKATRPHRASDSGRSEFFDWGVVRHSAPEQLWIDEEHADASADEFTYDALPIGEALLVYAVDETSGAYGRVEFTHDGSERTIEMRPTLELVARLVSDVDSTPITTSRITWNVSPLTDPMRAWGWTDGREFRAEDGVFRRNLPALPLWNPENPLEPPSRFAVTFEAAGFSTVHAEFDTGGGRVLDCGEVRMRPKEGQVLIAPGQGVEPKALAWMAMRTSAQPEWRWKIRNAFQHADGSVGVFLLDSSASTPDQPLFAANSWTSNERAAQWPTEAPQWIVVSLIDSAYEGERLFERRADGMYVAVPRREFELVLECGALPPHSRGDASWHIGWSWHGQWGRFNVATPRRVGEVTRVLVSSPADGAEIFWSTTGRPQGVFGTPTDIGGTIPVASLPLKLVLR